MDRSVARLARFEARNPNGYRAVQACLALGWSRTWFQVVLREHRLRQAYGTTNSPALPENGGNQPFTYRSARTVAQNEVGMARSAVVALAYLGLARAFCSTVQNIYNAADNELMARRFRRAVRRITFVMEEIRDLGAA
jgi:hypothetical protein